MSETLTSTLRYDFGVSRSAGFFLSIFNSRGTRSGDGSAPWPPPVSAPYVRALRYHYGTSSEGPWTEFDPTDQAALRAAGDRRHWKIESSKLLVEWPLPGLAGGAGEPTYIDFVSGAPVLRMRYPQIRSRTLYASGSWSHLSVTAFDGALINDGSTASVAGTAGDNALVTVNLGGSKNVREFHAWFTPLAPQVPEVIDRVSYSDNGVSFTHLFIQPILQGYYTEGGTATGVKGFLDFGAHQHLRFRFNTVAGGPSSYALREIQLYEYEGEHPSIDAYNIYNMATGSPVLHANRRQRSPPAD